MSRNFAKKVDNLNDWLDVKELVDILFANEEFARRINLTQEEIQIYFTLAITNPQQIIFLIGYEEGKPIGFSISKELIGVELGKSYGITFIVASFILPGIKNRTAVSEGLSLLRQWGYEKGHKYLEANIRTTGKFKALEKVYGFKPKFTLIRKEL